MTDSRKAALIAGGAGSAAGVVAGILVDRFLLGGGPGAATPLDSLAAQISGTVTYGSSPPSTLSLAAGGRALFAWTPTRGGGGGNYGGAVYAYTVSNGVVQAVLVIAQSIDTNGAVAVTATILNTTSSPMTFNVAGSSATVPPLSAVVVPLSGS